MNEYYIWILYCMLSITSFNRKKLFGKKLEHDIYHKPTYNISVVFHVYFYPNGVCHKNKNIWCLNQNKYDIILTWAPKYRQDFSYVKKEHVGNIDLRSISGFQMKLPVYECYCQWSEKICLHVFSHCSRQIDRNCNPCGNIIRTEFFFSFYSDWLYF